MFKYLEKLLGKSSSYYEMLMNSKKENSRITMNQIDELKTLMNDITTHCMYYTSKEDQQIFPTHDHLDWPLDPKLNPLPFIGLFETEHFYLELFVDSSRAVKSDKYQCLKVHLKKSTDSPLTRELLNHHKISEPVWSTINGKSFPIWEEIVHRFPDVNNHIKKVAPDHPWTLYKKAVATYEIPEYKIQLGGYPQWLINDVDFRKIKKLEFLLEFKLQDNCSLYYFYDHDLQEQVMIKQKL